jgi:hypothetical protein
MESSRYRDFDVAGFGVAMVEGRSVLGIDDVVFPRNLRYARRGEWRTRNSTIHLLLVYIWTPREAQCPTE